MLACAARRDARRGARRLVTLLALLPILLAAIVILLLPALLSLSASRRDARGHRRVACCSEYSRNNFLNMNVESIAEKYNDLNWNSYKKPRASRRDVSSACVCTAACSSLPRQHLHTRCFCNNRGASRRDAPLLLNSTKAYSNPRHANILAQATQLLVQ